MRSGLVGAAFLLCGCAGEARPSSDITAALGLVASIDADNAAFEWNAADCSTPDDVGLNPYYEFVELLGRPLCVRTIGFDSSTETASAQRLEWDDLAFTVRRDGLFTFETLEVGPDLDGGLAERAAQALKNSGFGSQLTLGDDEDDSPYVVHRWAQEDGWNYQERIIRDHTGRILRVHASYGG